MNRNLTPIDISNIPDLIRLVEEVKTTQTPRVLKQHDETVAVLMPVGRAVKPKKTKTKADYEAFQAAFGSWKEGDTQRLKKDLYADRQRNNTRPPIKL